MGKRTKPILFLIFLFFLNAFVSAQETDQLVFNLNTKNLPKLTTLSSKDDLFKEYCSIVESNYKLISAEKSPELMFFYYKNTENFSLYQLASRCNIPYETIATLNKINSTTDDIANKVIILPTVSGLFINLSKTSSSFEILLQENYLTEENLRNSITYKLNDSSFALLISKRLSPTERAFFLDSSLCLPLSKDSFWVSSEFGRRVNPFSGKIKNHNGIDLAAPEGTPVFAIKDAKVSGIFLNDETYGNYIILSHDNGKMLSIYAHLSKVCIEKFANVKKGDIIGYVGQTGMATGPHLHFEIKQGGEALDPRLKLNLQ